MSKNRFSLRTGDRNVAQDFTQSQLSVSFCVGRVESRGIFILYFIRAANDPLVLTITEKALLLLVESVGWLVSTDS